MAQEKITPDAAAEAVDAEATVVSEPSPLRVKPRETDGDDDLLGAPTEPAQSEAVDQIGAPVKAGKKKGLAGLFGGAKDGEDLESLDDTPTWAEPVAARPRRQGSGIRVVNRVLVAAIVLILLLGVLDLFATIRQPPGEVKLIDAPAVPDDGGEAGVPDLSQGLPVLAKLLESFARRPIVRNLDMGIGGTIIDVVPPRKKEPDWKAYVQNLDLIGFSGSANGEQEVIVVDHKADRMHILRLEQEMVAGESQFKLIRIAVDHVVFEKDGEEITVK